MDQNLENGGKFNYLYGLINLVVVFCIVWFLWYFFMHADGVMKLYTPMYGFSLAAMLLASVILLSKVLGWPGDGEKPLAAGPAIAKGLSGTVVSLAIMYFAYYVVFWLFIGGLGVAYFSPGALVAGGGTGAEPWNAREWASTAILYFSTAFLWWALVWNLGFGRWPWQKDGPWVVGFSRLFVVSFFAVITFAVMFHPHVCVLFPRGSENGGGPGVVGSLGRDRECLLGTGPGALHPVLGGFLRPVLGRPALQAHGERREGLFPLAAL